MREDVYTHLSNGANMVEYWHWASIAANQETYWKGVLSHDLEPNRAYAEVSRTAHELQKIGPHLVGLQIHNQVAILWSRDSANAIDFMPFTSSASGRSGAPARPRQTTTRWCSRCTSRSTTSTSARTLSFPTTTDFSAYKLLIVPALYIADDALLQRISDYVKNGGHVVMTFKSGFANENSAVRWVRAPGPLREAAGFSYQEFSNLEHPLALKGDPFHAGARQQGPVLGRVPHAGARQSARLLRPSLLRQVAGHHRKRVRRGHAALRGHLSLRRAANRGAASSELEKLGLTGPDQQLPAAVHVQHGVNRLGKRLHYYFNYSGAEVKLTYAYGAGTNLLDGKAVAKAAELTLAPWDLAIIEEQ